MHWSLCGHLTSHPETYWLTTARLLPVSPVCTSAGPGGGSWTGGMGSTCKMAPHRWAGTWRWPPGPLPRPSPRVGPEPQESEQGAANFSSLGLDTDSSHFCHSLWSSPQGRWKGTEDTQALPWESAGGHEATSVWPLAHPELSRWQRGHLAPLVLRQPWPSACPKLQLPRL